MYDCIQDGWTCLHLTCQRGHTATAEMLLDRGADIADKDEVIVVYDC